ncbi:hypothetical protein OBBRIDRAFT_77030 [Obba rivulosa]|uniref:Uncharacterized protein n=1 Tax=Obba rivulosa TaxID=1052685 RepID=A0A8E2DS81_9APHY|nr:hypothetical protein OBBRIDRAFT_77030 [Obba rivulosa]
MQPRKSLFPHKIDIFVSHPALFISSVHRFSTLSFAFFGSYGVAYISAPLPVHLLASDLGSLAMPHCCWTCPPSTPPHPHLFAVSAHLFTARRLLDLALLHLDYSASSSLL